MKNNMQETTFWKFLENHKIEIPIIQRDYAQGRIGKEKLREKFLKDLRRVLDSSLDRKDELKLDFVYGSIDENDSLNPLDGQQRLTTLWLLYWYIAHKAGKLEENKSIFKRFSYETRVSSRDFCQKLSEFYANSDEPIIISIQNQTWFLSEWKQDPTIQAMLNMLGGTPIKDKKQNEIIDGIEERFKNCKESDYIDYWKKLTNDNCPIIFYYLDLWDLELSDDLYIKMNARGKQLTAFENFKADLVGYITEKENEAGSKWEKSKTPQESIAHKLDVDWTNIFWKNKSSESKIDEIYFAFINRYLLNSLIVAKKENKDYLYVQENIESNNLFALLYGKSGDDTQINYQGFDVYKSEESIFDYTLFEKLKASLNNFKSDFDEKMFFPTWNVESDFRFIPEYKNDKPTTLTQQQRVVFHAICCYFERGEFEEQSLKQWMRVVWNIVENGNISGVLPMIGAIRLVDELAEYSHNIYDHLKDRDVSNDFAQEQMKEEKEKALRIKEKEKALQINEKGDEWEKNIIKAENTAFFKGAIRFLYRTDDNDVNWDLFDARFKKAEDYFDENGVKDGSEYQTDALLLKAFVSRVENHNHIWDKQVFDNKSNTWKELLIDPKFRIIMNAILSGDISKADEGTVEWHKRLYEHNLLSYVATEPDMIDSRVRWIHGHFAIYPPYRTGVILDMKTRDKILSELASDKIEINKNVPVDNMLYFWGWYIHFKYNEYPFVWDTDRKIHFDINQIPINTSQIGDLSFHEDSVGEDKNAFIEKLDELILKIKTIK
jgi:hypothetical protein